MRPIACALLVLMVSSCSWETHDVKAEDVQVFAPEEQFLQLQVGMTVDQVVKKVGAPRSKEQRATQEVWQYGIWRGESPSLLRFLFSSKQPPATLLEGEVIFQSGKVVTVHVRESSATRWPPEPSSMTNPR